MALSLVDSVSKKILPSFLIETIQDLKVQLSQLNIELLVYNEHPEVIIPKLCNTLNVEAIYLQKEWTQEEIGK